MHTLNTIIDVINSTTDSAERRVYRALNIVLKHLLAVVGEWEEMRFPQGAPPAIPRLHLVQDDWIVDYQTGEMRPR